MFASLGVGVMAHVIPEPVRLRAAEGGPLVGEKVLAAPPLALWLLLLTLGVSA